MKSKLENLIKEYENKLKRKETLKETLLELISNRINETVGENLCAEVDYVRFAKLESEITVLQGVLNDLKSLLEN